MEKKKDAFVNETWTLNDGCRIPVQGMGVFKVENDVSREIVINGIKAGIRLVDTAQAYENEEGVGDGIIQSGVPRGQLYITTKIWNSDHGYEKTLASMQKSLKRLKLSYVDLLLIHWPVPSKNLYVETYKALETLKKDGYVRSIGVSNFNVPHLEKLLDACETVPAVNQIEIHPYLTNCEVVDFCQGKGIAVQAWSPLGKAMVLDDEVIRGIGRKYGRSAAQVVLRWHYQKKILTIPKSVRTERTIENTDIFSFELTGEEMKSIDALNRNYRTGPDPDEFSRE